jgi:hypothetical protein
MQRVHITGDSEYVIVTSLHLKSGMFNSDRNKDGYIYLFKKLGYSFAMIKEFKFTQKSKLLIRHTLPLTLKVHYITEIHSVKLPGWGNYILLAKNLGNSAYFYFKIEASNIENLTEKLFS